MAFKRAQWHSGLTYRQTCRECKTVMEYTDEILDFRPWYADGFVYCSRCRTPLRHSEDYAINGTVAVKEIAEAHISANETAETQAPAEQGDAPKFCTSCGHPFRDGDRFCAQCGNKR